MENTASNQSNQVTSQDVLEDNSEVLEEFFAGIASGEYYDGMSHQLYLDTNDRTMEIVVESSSNSWSQRDDDSLVQIAETSGCLDSDQPLYDKDEDSLSEFGYGDWYALIEQKVDGALSEIRARAEI